MQHRRDLTWHLRAGRHLMLSRIRDIKSLKYASMADQNPIGPDVTRHATRSAVAS